jgi:hypothetical protein
MKVPVAFVLCLSIVAQAGKALPDNQPSLVICMDSGPGTGFPATHAEALASKMFSTIGVHLDWHHGGHGCKLPVEGTIHISMTTGEGPDKFPGALAIAWLGDAAHRIEVFYDRVTQTTEPSLVPGLLAHVLVHEITHTIEGLNRHSESGVMKAHWDETDYHAMSYEPLPFAPTDIALLRERIGAGTTETTASLVHGRSVGGIRPGAGSVAFSPPVVSPSSNASIVP